MQTPQIRASSRSMRTRTRGFTHQRFSPDSNTKQAPAERTLTLPASSARRRSSSARSTWAPTCWQRQSTASEEKATRAPAAPIDALRLYRRPHRRVERRRPRLTREDGSPRSSRIRRWRPLPTPHPHWWRRCEATTTPPSGWRRGPNWSRSSGRQHHDGVCPVRKGVGGARCGPPRRCIRIPWSGSSSAVTAYHPVISSWLIADLAEAALHIGQVDAARGRVDQVARNTGDRTGAWVAIGLRHARALLADQAAAACASRRRWRST